MWSALAFAFNILILKAIIYIKMPLITLIHCDHIWALYNLFKAENVKLEHLNEILNCATKWKKMQKKQISQGNWRVDPSAVESENSTKMVVDLTLTVY